MGRGMRLKSKRTSPGSSCRPGWGGHSAVSSAKVFSGGQLWGEDISPINLSHSSKDHICVTLSIYFHT